MTYLIVNDGWTVTGGTERRLVDYEIFLKRQGHKVFVQTADRYDEADYDTVDVAEFHNIFRFGFEIFKHFINHYPEKAILYPHDFYPVCFRRVLGRRFLGAFRRCEKPGWLRCLNCAGLKPYRETMIRLKAFRQVRKMKLVSNFMVKKYQRLGFSLCEYEVDIQKTSPAFKRIPGIVRNPRLIGFSGRDKEYKGFLVLKRAIHLLQKRGVPYEFEYTGEKNWLSLEDMVDFYNRVRVVVVPSIWEEPAPLVAREAHACGALVVGSDIGGVAETNPDYLFRPGDAHQLADILQSILEEGVRND